MEDKENVVEESEVIKAIRQEYDKKIEEINKTHQEELKKIKEEEEQKRIKDISALISGRKYECEEKVEETHKSYYENVIDEVKAKFKLK